MLQLHDTERLRRHVDLVLIASFFSFHDNYASVLVVMVNAGDSHNKTLICYLPIYIPVDFICDALLLTV